MPITQTLFVAKGDINHPTFLASPDDAEQEQLEAVYHGQGQILNLVHGVYEHAVVDDQGPGGTFRILTWIRPIMPGQEDPQYA
jgi:hypothetical protein